MSLTESRPNPRVVDSVLPRRPFPACQASTHNIRLQACPFALLDRDTQERLHHKSLLPTQGAPCMNPPDVLASDSVYVRVLFMN